MRAATLTRAHLALRQKQESGEFTVSALAKRLAINPLSLQGILSGSIPKITVALALEQHVQIPLTWWTERKAPQT